MALFISSPESEAAEEELDVLGGEEETCYQLAKVTVNSDRFCLEMCGGVRKVPWWLV